MGSQRRALPLLLVLAALFYGIFILRTAFEVKGQTYFTLVDDAMISMRYARNLAEGHGLVWNAGQKPVEGITNPGWTLAMAAIHLLKIPQPFISLAVMVLAAGILLGNTAVVFEIGKALQPGSRVLPLIAATACAFYFPLVFWTLRGLETGALALCLSLAILLALRGDEGKAVDQWKLAAALAAAVLLRMDAILPAAIILLYVGSRSRQGAILPGLVTILVFISVLVFQKVYFGDFLPNTYYLKVVGVSAWERVRVGLISLNDYAWRDFAMPLFIVFVGFLSFKETRTREAVFLLSIFLVQVVYSVWVGGDYAEELVDAANRFIAQGMPALILLASLVIERLLTEKRARLSFLAALIGLGMALVMSGEPWMKWAVSNAPMLRTDIQRVKLGLHIREHTDSQAVIAVHAAGQIPYYSGLTSIDLLGKSDPVIAKGPPATVFAPGHNKWNYEYSILQLKPDVVADNFNKLRGFMEDQSSYSELPNGIYVRADSRLVDMNGLGSDYR